MRIAINTRLLLPGKLDGIGWFTYETVRRIVCSHPEHQFFFFFDRTPSDEYLFASNVTFVKLGPPARHPILWYLFFEYSVTRALRKYNIDIFLSPDGWISLRTDVPTLAVIHDLNFEHATDYLRPSHQRYMTRFFPQFAHKATRVATVSEFSKTDLVNTYHIPAEKVDVVYDGAHTNYTPLSREECAQALDKFAVKGDYFLFVSTILKRKNLTNTLLAFDDFKESDCEGIKLVVVGAKVWWQDELKEAYDTMRHKEDVIFLGRVEAADLAQLMSASLGLVYVSFFEGFGIPILEAFYAETPVITSHCTSMPEIAGDAALLVDPHDVKAVSEAMRQLVVNPDLARRLVEKGRLQRQKFSWDRTASLLWNSILKITSKKSTQEQK